MHNGRWVEVARLFDYQNTEFAVHQLKTSLSGFLEINTLSEAVGSTLFVMPSALSNANWMKHEDPLAYARGTGMAYAYGAHMHVPWCLYDSQSMRFYGSLQGHQPIFQMIYDNRNFFDGYVLPLWHLALVPYSDQGVPDQAVLTRMVTDFSSRGIPLVVRLRDEARLRTNGSAADNARLIEKDRLRFGEDRLMGTTRSQHVAGDDYAKYLGKGPVRMERGFSENFYAPVARVFAGSSRFPLALHLIRADFNPPRYGATFASTDYRKGILVGLRQWIDKGADGVQLDDVFGMLNRGWRYGGDFSPDMLTAVRGCLTQRQYPGISPATPLDELRDLIVAEMRLMEPVRVADSGWIDVPATSDKYPGQVWLGSPELARVDGYLTTELEFLFEGKALSGVEFSLMNGSRSSYLGCLALRAGRLCAETADGLRDADLSPITSGTWIPLRLEFDLAANTFRCADGPKGFWSDWLPFVMNLSVKQSRLALNIWWIPVRDLFGC